VCRWVLALGLLAACGDAKVDDAPRSAAPAASSQVDFLDGACQRGNDLACEKLWTAHKRGEGTAQSTEKATELMRRLCEEGRRNFCPGFALSLHQGEGIAADPPRARQLFIDTCAFDPVACSEFGNLFSIGLGLKKDLAMARLLLDLACREREPKACEELAVLPPRNLREQEAETRRLQEAVDGGPRRDEPSPGHGPGDYPTPRQPPPPTAPTGDPSQERPRR
jgi:TPR repeat protein